MAFLGGEEGAALCIALLCTIVLLFNLDGTWMEIDQSEDRILISINL
jgi:hypothetical protein